MRHRNCHPRAPWGQADWEAVLKEMLIGSPGKELGGWPDPSAHWENIEKLTTVFRGWRGLTHLTEEPPRQLSHPWPHPSTDSVNRDWGWLLAPVDRAKCCQQHQSRLEQKSAHHTECVSPQPRALSPWKPAASVAPPWGSPNALPLGETSGNEKAGTKPKNNLQWNNWASQLAQRLPKQATWVQLLGWEDPLEEEMATHFSILAWEIPRAEEAGRLQSMGSQKSRTQLSNWACSHEGLTTLWDSA